MSALIIVEHDNVHMQPTTRSLLTAALQLDLKPVCLVMGYQCQQVAKEVATLAGVDKVLMVDDAAYQHLLAENASALITSIAASFTALLIPASTFGKNLMPRVAANLDMGQVSDVSRIIDKQTFEHPIYAGNAIETVRVNDAIKILTIRCTAFKAVVTTQEPCEIEAIPHLSSAIKTAFVSQELNTSTRPALGDAKIIVSGGRGLQSAEKFKLVEALADALGAAIGASRAAVDAGFVANEFQVGQTGKIVAPDLYIALGISGAVQHLAGMKDSKIIVAINKDNDAPIFQIADYGLVGDVFEVIPQLIDLLRKKS